MARMVTAQQQLAQVALACLRSEVVSEGAAALFRSLFPSAASLRVCLLTGDPQVLASVGSLLAPGCLGLALVPVRASAAGAAVVRRGPIYLTREASRGLACYDFEGGSIFCMPLMEPPLPGAIDGTAGTGALPGAAPGGRCLGALLLSFPPVAEGGEEAPRQLDSRNLQLLSASLAPGAQAAASELLLHCSWILGVPQPGTPHGGRQAGAAATAAGGEEADESSGSSEFMPTDSEEEEWEDEEEEDEESRAAGRRGGEEAQAPPVEWSPGACRGDGSPPPDDPGASAAAVPVSQTRSSAPEPDVSTQGSSAAPGQQQQWVPPESPSAVKARAKRGDAGPALLAAGGSMRSSVSTGSMDTASSSLHSELLKVSPTSTAEGEQEGGSFLLLDDTSAAQLAAATPGWHRLLLTFADPQAEARYAALHHRHLWKLDVTSASLFLALHLSLLLSSASIASIPSSSSAAAWQGWMAGLADGWMPVAAVLPMLGLMLTARHTYLRNRDSLLLTAYLCCALWQLYCCDGQPGVLLPVMLGLAVQGRFAVQAPLQALLLAASAAALLQHGTFDWSPQAVGVAAAAAVLPLLLLNRQEALGRRLFLACIQPPQAAAPAQSVHI